MATAAVVQPEQVLHLRDVMLETRTLSKRVGEATTLVMLRRTTGQWGLRVILPPPGACGRGERLLQVARGQTELAHHSLTGRGQLGLLLHAQQQGLGLQRVGEQALVAAAEELALLPQRLLLIRRRLKQRLGRRQSRRVRQTAELGAEPRCAGDGGDGASPHNRWRRRAFRRPLERGRVLFPHPGAYARRPGTAPGQLRPRRGVGGRGRWAGWP